MFSNIIVDKYSSDLNWQSIQFVVWNYLMLRCLWMPYLSLTQTMLSHRQTSRAFVAANRRLMDNLVEGGDASIIRIRRDRLVILVVTYITSTVAVYPIRPSSPGSSCSWAMHSRLLCVGGDVARPSVPLCPSSRNRL
jgi:hypothetical protein